MIDVWLVNDGRRLMNSKEEEERTAYFFVILTFDRIIKTMNDIRRTLKSMFIWCIYMYKYMLRSTNTHT